VAFLRTRIEFIEAFFAPGEVSEIWLTFSDPQLHSQNSRLTSPLFLERYRNFLAPGGIVHLKTDSRFLHEYTRAVISANALELLSCSTDIYNDAQFSEAVLSNDAAFRRGVPSEIVSASLRPLPLPSAAGPSLLSGRGWPEISEGTPLRNSAIDTEIVTGVQTFYEGMFLEMGLPITYLAFRIDKEGPFVYPEEFDEEYWREQEGPRRTFSHQPSKKA
jgi:tRNA (guanine-N7-)-methyltransferase